ncbi:sulfite exporter TauE/SafE family protein [Paraglaciecola aquimarina]|uniref:Probable membrane transporter protein n=1 Tax=Paraglaciecola aquimarina TaxID=1235557 RepID=A0ABU3SX55_9ALTE|nr:sulfite exporter TauE/SafE family protein [Paraglaciecola aquimarina]MDU0354599.1 sulfite exporter TauE/SafE family protein [Paraglaciecola aquimarina]
MYSMLSATRIRMFLLLFWIGIFSYQAEPWLLLQEYAGFTLLGILGAVLANATGAGGGVVFVPFFNQLDFNVAASVATSFAIQCCGMTAGAITWWAYYRKMHLTDHSEKNYWQSLSRVICLTVPASIIGVWMVQLQPQFFVSFSDPQSLHAGFGIFSILLSIAIFCSALLLNKPQLSVHLTHADCAALVLIAWVGGGITAWLSIGVGELLAVYLIIRGFNVTFAIAAAVMLSAFTVWGGVIFHLWVTHAIYWPVVLFAGAGAIIGGILAKQLVLFFSPKNLKLFFAGWVFILGVVTLPF